jgi:uncharacterized protein DUF998
MARKMLLVCGILSPILYAISDVVAGMRWEAYSFRDQTISELAAIGAPSRPLFAALLLVVYGLMVAFGIGVWESASAIHRLRIVGGLLIGLGVSEVSKIELGLATPWLGVKERIFWYGYQSWFAALAVRLLRTRHLASESLNAFKASRSRSSAI